uniref:Uncharacterized protein n=1 Tax=Lutzomyia longipalpis TaxID=7200 RepID=A0A1B0CT61_LUTLO
MQLRRSYAKKSLFASEGVHNYKDNKSQMRFKRTPLEYVKNIDTETLTDQADITPTPPMAPGDDPAPRPPMHDFPTPAAASNDEHSRY